MATYYADKTGSTNIDWATFSNGFVVVSSGAVSNVTYTATTSYTPVVTLAGGTGNTVPQYTTNSGLYSVVGSVCHVDVYLAGDGGNEGAGSGQINVSLPLTASASDLAGYFNCGTVQNSTTLYNTYGTIGPSATTIALTRNNVSAVAAVVGTDQNSTTRFIRLKFSYRL